MPKTAVHRTQRFLLQLLITSTTAFVGCTQPARRPGEPLLRTNDEIMVCGQLVHTGTPVVLWTDPGGYDAYRVERRFAPLAESSWENSQGKERLKTPNRYGLRKKGLTPEQIERVRGGGWDLPLLQDTVDQFVIHYDVCGVSRQCFAVLHDRSDLSVHFMLDLDGTIYQTLDLKERAWHATIANDQSIGIEIANMGAYDETENDPFEQWYTRDPDGRLRITIPPAFGDGGIRTANFVGHPARDDLVTGEINGRRLRQYDFTPQQYAALIKLTATLARVFPKIKLDYPRDASGALTTHKLPDDQLAAYQGVLGHYHIQTEKVDPGPAFQWERVINGARKLMR
ncbi:MAG TPA: peptidoglycan recognition family protein [Phycisphaerae bacterium]